jgi:hypothetical protein
MNIAKKIKVNVFDDLRESLEDATPSSVASASICALLKLPDPPPKLRARDIRNLRGH